MAWLPPFVGMAAGIPDVPTLYLCLLASDVNSHVLPRVDKYICVVTSGVCEHGWC